VSGELYYGSKLNNTLRAFGFAPAVTGQPYYVSDENGEKTYAASVGSDGTISNLKLFEERGGEGLTVDEKGNVYIATGQILVYNSSGDLIDTVDVPERPSQLLFGGRDGHTLFVLARTSLYAVQTTNKGR
jgi:sugar lactone lactonase YvrE